MFVGGHLGTSFEPERKMSLGVFFTSVRIFWHACIIRGFPAMRGRVSILTASRTDWSVSCWFRGWGGSDHAPIYIPRFGLSGPMDKDKIQPSFVFVLHFPRVSWWCGVDQGHPCIHPESWRRVAQELNNASVVALDQRRPMDDEVQI